MSEEHERRLSRRSVLASTAGVAFVGLAGGRVATAGAASGAPAATTPFSPGAKEIVVGTVKRIAGSSTIVLHTDAGTRSVDFTSTALFWREQPASIDAFQTGDQVVIEGSSASGAFVGDAMINVYRNMAAAVRGRSGQRLETSQGRVRLIGKTKYEQAGTLSAVPDGKVAPGAELDALVRVDGPTGDLVALRIY